MYCRTCGRPLPIGTVQCPTCGWSSTPSLAIPSLPAKGSSNAAVIAVGIGVGPASEEEAVRTESAVLLSQFSLLQTSAAAAQYSGR